MQLIQNAASQLVFNLPKFSHTTPLLRTLHWLLVAAWIWFNTLLPCCEWLWPILHPGHGQTIHPSLSTTLCYCQMDWFSFTVRGVQLPLNKITTVWCPNKQTNKTLSPFIIVSKCSTWSISEYLIKLMCSTCMFLAICGLYPHGWMRLLQGALNVM